MDVFISHSARDADIAKRIAEGLQSRGLSLWLDTEQLKPGEAWEREIQKALWDSKYVLLLFSPSSSSVSKWQQYEWQTALESAWANPAKRLVGVAVDEAETPAFLSSWPVYKIRSTSTDWDALVENIARGLKREAEPNFIALGNPTGEQEARLAAIREEAQLLAPRREELAAEKKQIQSEIDSVTPNHFSYAELLFRRAMVERELGDVDAAYDSLSKALNAALMTHGRFHPLTATLLVSLSAMNRARGDYASALSQLRSALEIYEVTRGETSSPAAETLMMLASFSHESGDTEAAMEYLNTAEKLGHRTGSPLYPGLANLRDRLRGSKTTNHEHRR